MLQVASALHDNCKGVLVGDRTFGKVLIVVDIYAATIYSSSWLLL